MAVVPLAPAFAFVRDRRRLVPAIALMVVAVVALHFTGMASIRLTPTRVAPGQDLMLSGDVMSVLVGLAALLCWACA
jgi:NO-binding membrane sensor protein with MHYT domain